MKMLRYSGLAVLVVCIAAFASGCGGGGGGTADEDMTTVMECPQGQIGTYPDCMDPPKTDADRIADARRELSSILTNARARAGAASSAAAAIRTNADATPAQITDANSESNTAQGALADIVSANTAATLATTPAEANTALADAREAQVTLNTSASAISRIQGVVQAAANRRMEREVDERAATNGSSLIQHVRANKLLSDAVLDVTALTTGTTATEGSIVVGEVGATARDVGGVADTESCTAPCATYAADTGPATARVTGQRTVSVQDITSDSKTTLLTGTGPLPHGFDLTNATGATYVNAYTDITKTRLNVRTRTNVVNDDPDVDGDQRYEEVDVPDADYLLAGIWLTVGANFDASRITAFAYGSQPIPASFTFCSGIEASDATTVGTTTTDRNCVVTDGVNTIEAIVDDGKDMMARYRGNANGAYIAGGDTSYFTASVELTAEFRNPTGGSDSDNNGSIQGAVTNIVAGGQSMAGSIELQKQPLENVISTPFFAGTSIGVVDDKSFRGGWKGQFFGRRATKSIETERTGTAPNITTTITTTYAPAAPGSVAGTFYATQQSNPAREAAFIGAFGAHR